VRRRGPRVLATVRADGTGEVVIGGRTVPIEGGDLAEAGRLAVEVAATRAAQVGRPVRMAATSPAGTRLVVVHPDGRLTSDDDASRRRLPTYLLVAAGLTALVVVAGWMALHGSPPGRASQGQAGEPSWHASTGAPEVPDPTGDTSIDPSPIDSSPTDPSLVAPRPRDPSIVEEESAIPPRTPTPVVVGSASAVAPDVAGTDAPASEASAPDGEAPPPGDAPEGEPARDAPEATPPSQPAPSAEESTDAPPSTPSPTSTARGGGTKAHAPAKERTGATGSSGNAGRRPTQPDSATKGFVLWQED
jgi:hypothetical protein